MWVYSSLNRIPFRVLFYGCRSVPYCFGHPNRDTDLENYPCRCHLIVVIVADCCVHGVPKQ